MENRIVYSGISPHLTIRDGRASEAIDFYMRAFGVTEIFRKEAQDGKRLMHAHLEVNGGALFLNDDFPEMMGGIPSSAPTGVTLHLEVADADVAWERALAAGASVRFPLENQFWGQRYGQVFDPFGHCWSIGGPVKD
jgi:PhnB protein